MSKAATVTPWAASSAAVAAPIPLAPPVTIATRLMDGKLAANRRAAAETQTGARMYPGTWAEATPDKDAIVMGGGERVTYRELNDRSMQLAQLLYARGLRPGDHIAIFAENHPRYYEVYWAAMRSGLYLTAVNRHLKADEAAYLVNDSGSTVLITTAAMGGVASEMLEHIDGCPTRLMMDGAADGFESYEDAIAAQPAQPL